MGKALDTFWEVIIVGFGFFEGMLLGLNVAPTKEILTVTGVSDKLLLVAGVVSILPFLRGFVKSWEYADWLGPVSLGLALYSGYVLAFYAMRGDVWHLRYSIIALVFSAAIAATGIAYSDRSSGL